MSEDAIYFPPLDKGAHVATDVVPSVTAGFESFDTHADLLLDAYEPKRADVVLVAVPAGEGVAVEAAIRRALRVEAS